MIRVRLFLLKLALLNTFKKKFRAFLAVGGIALSVSVMVLLFGVSSGLQGLVTEHVTNSDSKDILTVNQRNLQEIRLNDELLSKIKSTSGVGQLEQLVGLVGTLTYHGIDLNVPVYAVSEDYFSLAPQEKRAGDTLRQPVNHNIVLSTKAMEIFDIPVSKSVGRELKLSLTIPSEYNSSEEQDTIDVRQDTFKIVAGVNRGELPVAYVPLEYARQNGLTSVSQLKMRLTSQDKLTAVRESIEQMGLQTTSVQDSIQQVNRIFAAIQRVMLLFGFITLVITVFGTFNVITLTLIEETQQVGFLRIQGLQKHHIAFLFIMQSMMLTAVGAFVGIVVGSLGGFVFNGVAQALVGETVFDGAIYIFKLPLLPIIIMLMLSLALGWLIGKVPSKRAMSIEPLEELRG